MFSSLIVYFNFNYRVYVVAVKRDYANPFLALTARGRPESYDDVTNIYACQYLPSLNHNN